MSTLFHWSVETPDGVTAGGECELLVIPCAHGEVGVLAGHAPLLAEVVPGTMRLSGDERISVGRGVAEVRAGEVHLFVTEARRWRRDARGGELARK